MGCVDMARLGKEQLRLLYAVGTHMFMVVADKRTKRLCELGLMAEARPNAFVYCTANGLRAVADAADRGRLVLGKLPEPPPTAGNEGASLSKPK